MGGEHVYLVVRVNVGETCMSARKRTVSSGIAAACGLYWALVPFSVCAGDSGRIVT